MTDRLSDRVLASDYLDGLSEADLAEVRSRRHDAEQVETDLSYLRRLLQGRLDILRAELARRSGGDGGEIVDSLARILADAPSPAGPRGLGRHMTAEPSDADAQILYVESLVPDIDVSEPGAGDDETLRRAIDVLENEERVVSARRRAVQQVMDACTAELGRRYRDGDADVSDLLPTEA
jgi:hypothetical protein